MSQPEEIPFGQGKRDEKGDKNIQKIQNYIHSVKNIQKPKEFPSASHLLISFCPCKRRHNGLAEQVARKTRWIKGRASFALDAANLNTVWKVCTMKLCNFPSYWPVVSASLLDDLFTTSALGLNKSLTWRRQRQCLRLDSGCADGSAKVPGCCEMFYSSNIQTN